MYKAHVIYRDGKQLVAFVEKEDALSFCEMYGIEPCVSHMYYANINVPIVPDLYSEILRDEEFLKMIEGIPEPELA